jgi:hypothetical protein
VAAVWPLLQLQRWEVLLQIRTVLLREPLTKDGEVGDRDRAGRLVDACISTGEGRPTSYQYATTRSWRTVCVWSSAPAPSMSVAVRMLVADPYPQTRPESRTSLSGWVHPDQIRQMRCRCMRRRMAEADLPAILPTTRGSPWIS